MSLDSENYFSPLIPDDRRKATRAILAHAFRAARGYDGKESSEDTLIERLSAFEQCAHELAGRSSLDRDGLEGVISAQILHARKPVTVTDLLALAVESFGKRLEAGTLDINIEKTSFHFLPTGGDGEIIGGTENGLLPIRFEARTHQLIAALNRSGIFIDDLLIYQGAAKKRMLRQQPYNLIQIPRLNREIAICDQAGEATFIGHGLYGLQFWASHSKEQLLGIEGISRVTHHSDWVSRIVGLLLENNQPGPKINIPLRRDIPKKEENWLSSNELTSIYIGTGKALKQLLESHAESLRQKLVTQGRTSEEAAAEIDQQYIGYRFLGGGPKAICASPSTIAELELAGKLRFKSEKAPVKESDWLSTGEMKSIYIGDDSAIFKQVLESYAETLRQELIAQGKTPEEAAAEVDQKYAGMRIIEKRHRESMCASPAALSELERMKKLRLLSDKAPPKESGWVSYTKIRFTHVDNGNFKQLFKSYAEAQRQKLITQGITPEEATAEVNRSFIGNRGVGTKESVCASPLAIAELEEAGKIRPLSKKAPIKEPGWLSTSELGYRYIGDTRDFKKVLEPHAENIRLRLIAQGRTPEEAAVEVDKEYMGIRSTRGPESICASPRMIAELEQAGKLRPLDKRVPAKAPDWRSNGGMQSAYIGGAKSFKRLLESYAENLRQKLVAQGKTSEEADAEVDQHVGIRTVRGSETMCASPSVIAELEQQGKLLKRDTNQKQAMTTTPSRKVGRARVASDRRMPQL